jgi:hypothetical protein
MDMRLITQVTPGGVYAIDQSDPHPRIEVGYYFLHSLSANPEQFFQELTFPTGKKSKRISGGQSDMQMRNFQDVLCDVVYPVIHADLAAGRAEAGLAGEGDAMLILAAGTDPASKTAIRVTAEQHALNTVPDVSLLIEGDFVGQG